MTHFSILHIILSVYGVGNCCAVVLSIQMLPYCLFKDTMKMAVKMRLFWITILSLASSFLWSTGSC
jgi:hypothetical protein